MKPTQYIFYFLLLFLIWGCKSDKKDSEEFIDTEETVEVDVTEEIEEKALEKTVLPGLRVNPVSHATMVLTWDDKVLYIDPVGGDDTFANFPSPDLILVTDIHGDHLNVETLQAVSTDKTKMMVPQAVADKLPSEFDAQVDVLNNGDVKERFGFNVEAVPMYNLREEALKFHEKGRGNGYVIEKGGQRVYISGDTEDIPEMRALADIDIAFVCMNLPYTMTVESAADAVLEFNPGLVYPYHYRGTDGLSDVAKFKELVNSENSNIAVVQLDWYSN